MLGLFGNDVRNANERIQTVVQTDAAGRVTLVRRGPTQGDGPLMSATYSYYDDDRVSVISYLNGTSVEFQCDDARRLTRIMHKNDPLVLMRLDYTYTARDEIATITETNGTETYVTTFDYDEQGRLVEEERERTVGSGGTPVEYHFKYTYDAGGNRTKKEDLAGDIEVRYTYDIDNPSAYGSDNNRLMYYETYDVSVQPEDLLSTTWYYYNESGNPTRIVTQEAASPDDFKCTRVAYARNQQAVTFILGEEWDWDGDPEHDPTNYEVTYAREFRYDSGRARYLVRTLNPTALQQGNYTVISDTWSDYDGDAIYGDYTISGSAFVNARSFEPGMATVDPWASSGGDNTEYFHTNHLGTTRFMSDPDGDPVDAAVYTAFGERVDGTNHRYGYAGAYGYQAHDFPSADPIPYLHVGARYYDPASGRFLQRDPIGVAGGLNVYTYVRSGPVMKKDPQGQDWDGIDVPGLYWPDWMKDELEDQGRGVVDGLITWPAPSNWPLGPSGRGKGPGYKLGGWVGEGISEVVQCAAGVGVLKGAARASKYAPAVGRGIARGVGKFLDEGLQVLIDFWITVLW